MNENGVSERSAIDAPESGGAGGGIGRSRFLAAAGGALFGLAAGLGGGVDPASAATKYPGEIDKTLKPEEEGGAILAIEGELGANPSGGLATVDARIAALGPLNVMEYGAKGDGETDDKSAVKTAIEAAMSAGRPLLFPGGRTFKVPGLAVSVASPLHLIGQGSRLLGTSNSDSAVLTPAADLTIEGLTIDTLGRFIQLNELAATIAIAIRNCAFVGCFSPVHWDIGKGGEALSRFVFTDSRIENCKRGACLDGVEKLESALFANNLVYNTGRAGFRVHHDPGNEDDAEVQLNNKDIAVVGNVMRQIYDETSPNAVANGVLINGYNATIIGNVIEGVTVSDESDAEAIYTKCRFATIVGNVVRDCQKDQGAIAIKRRGNPETDTEFSKENNGWSTICANNVIENCKVGIFCQNEYTVISGNRIENYTDKAIYVSEGPWSKIQIVGNQIVDAAATATQGIMVKAYGEQILIHANLVAKLPASINQAVAGIQLDVGTAESGKTQKQVSIRGNHVDNVTNASGEGTANCIYVNPRSKKKATITEVSIGENDLSDTATAIRFNKGTEATISKVSILPSNVYRGIASRLNGSSGVEALEAVEIENGVLVSTGGVRTKVVAGAVSDGSFPAAPGSGTLAVDSANSKLYVRVGSTWKSVTLT